MTKSTGKGQSTRLVLSLLSGALLIVIVGLPVLAILLYAVFPNFNTLSFAEPFSKLAPSLADHKLIGATINSIELSLGVTLLSALIAVPLGYFRARGAVPAGKAWDALFLIPFLIPPYIGSLAWMQVLQRNGFLEQILGFDLGDLLYSFPGMVTVMALHLFPLVYFAASRAFSLIGSRYGDVAKVFGGRPLSIFARIELPLAIPAILSSALIVFILTIEEFGTPEILGRRFGFEVIVTAIHDKFTNWPIDLSGASVLCLILIALAFIAYHLHLRMASRFDTSVETGTMSPTASHRPLIQRAAILAAFFAVTLIGVILPVASIAISGFMTTISGGLAWDNFSLVNYAQIFSLGSDALVAVGTSLSLAVAAAILTGVIALIVAFAVVRLRGRGTAFLDFMSILPNALPGMAVAVGLILTWNLPIWPVSPYNTTAILLLAYLCLMLPYPIRMVSAQLRQLPTSLDDAAYISGANEWVVILRVLAPILLPVSLAAGFIVFAVSTRELVSSLMLAPPGVETVATYVFRQFDQGDINVAMAMSMLVVVVSGSIIALGQKLQKDQKT